jgi:transposase
VTGQAFYFQDEMRFGTRTELGRRWTAKAVRPSGEQIIGYDYGYLSVALNPRSGELFALILPDMTVESFQAFVDEFAIFLGEQTSVRLITDGAAAHRSTRLKIKEELLIEHLPAYSPELNPVERLFKELRKQLKNRVFESLEAVEEAVIKAIEPFLKDGSRVKKLTFYGWLHTTPT